MNVRVTRQGTVAIAALSRPPANAMTHEFCETIAETVDGLARDTAVQAIVLTAEGSIFSAGMDIKLVPAYGRQDQDRAVRAINRMVQSVYGCPRPIVVALNGHAIAGGFVLALCGDVRIAADGAAKFGVAEVRVGIPYPIAAMEVVRAELRPDVARLLALQGEPIPVAQALAWHVIDEVVPAAELPARALATAQRMASLPAQAFARIKRQLRSESLARIDAVVARDNDPLLGNWLTGETAAASAAQLAGGRR